jgi:5-hydroxyisourate hydrolase-like protein (transthyretin family)
MGRVVDPVGSPLARAIVYLTEFTAVPGTSGRQNGAEVRTCRTDADGRFRIPLNVGNEYQDWIYVRKDGFNCVYPVGVTTYRPHLGETRDLGTVALAAADGIITGRIIDASGKAAPGMVVAAKGARTAVSAATTDGDGRFRVANLVPGEPLQIEVYKGEVYDSADPGRQSNNEWYRTGVRAGMSGLVIPLRDADVGKRIAVRAN